MYVLKITLSNGDEFFWGHNQATKNINNAKRFSSQWKAFEFLGDMKPTWYPLIVNVTAESVSPD